MKILTCTFGALSWARALFWAHSIKHCLGREPEFFRSLILHLKFCKVNAWPCIYSFPCKRAISLYETRNVTVHALKWTGEYQMMKIDETCCFPLEWNWMGQSFMYFNMLSTSPSPSPSLFLIRNVYLIFFAHWLKISRLCGHRMHLHKCTASTCSFTKCNTGCKYAENSLENRNINIWLGFRKCFAQRNFSQVKFRSSNPYPIFFHSVKNSVWMI